MAETVVVRLAMQDEASASWVLVDAAGNPSGSLESGPLSAATPLAAGRRVIAIVPGVDILLAEPELPVRGGARLAQVVPFALEEQLADDLDDLHFAIGRRGNDRPGTPVAVVARARLEAWLEALSAFQLDPQAIYPDSALLPSNPSQTVLLIEENRLYVRHPGKQPFVLQADPLAAVLELAGIYPEPDEASEATEPRHVIAYVTEEDWNRHQETLDAARERLATLNIQLLPAGALPLLAQQAVNQPPINLRQGAYAARSQFTDVWRRWRIAAFLLIGLIGLNLLGTGVELWRLKQTERSLDAAIEQTFREAMPGEQNATNARRRMEARLAAVRGTSLSGDASILPMLSATGAAFAQVPNARLHALSFRNHVLDLRVAAGDVGSLSRLETLVAQRGYSAQLQSSTHNESGVEGRVQIKAGGAR